MGCFLNLRLLLERVHFLKALGNSYFCISYFGHACPKLNFVLISCLPGNAQHTIFKTYAILVYGYVDIS